MNVQQLLARRKSEVSIIGPHVTVAELTRLLAARKKGMALVCDDDRKLLGVVSVMDVNRAVAEHAERAPAMPVSRIMTRNYCACQPDDSVEEALRTMTDHGIRHLPVVAGGVLEGLLNIRDLLEQRFEDAELQTREMRDYVFGVGYH